MKFTGPLSYGYTVYGKSGCSYCDKVKLLLDEFKEQYTYINCDEYLIGEKDAFLKFIEELAGKEHTTFPMVFSSLQFVGGYTDTFKMLINSHEEE